MEHEYFDVVIVGGGPRGLSAGLFTARHGLSTLIFDRGTSQLKQCAYLDNYLGFPGGIDADEFLRLSQRQAEDLGCRVLQQRVLAVQRSPHEGARFLVRTAKAKHVLAQYCVVASAADVDYLQALDTPSLLDAEGELCESAVDSRGRTPVAGLYVADLPSEVESQVVIAAGQGAQVALALLRDHRFMQTRFEVLARHFDWQVFDGTYSKNWEARVHAYFAKLAPSSSADAAQAFEAAVVRWLRDKRAQQLSRAEIERRRQHARNLAVRPEPEKSRPFTPLAVKR